MSIEYKHKSKLDPHFSFIQEMREKGWSYRDIQEKLKAEKQLKTSPSTIQQFCKIRKIESSSVVKFLTTESINDDSSSVVKIKTTESIDDDASWIDDEIKPKKNPNPFGRIN